MRLTLIPLLALNAALPMTAFAKNFEDDIVVTATKVKASVSDLGISVSVIDGERLSQLDSAEELSRYLSGVQAAVANGNQIAFQIRGIGAVDHQALTPTAAAVYVDGVYQATNVQTGPLLFDIERAEVLKGPQGSLYGRNATAGAINFISKRPTTEKEGYIAGEYGRFNRVNLRAAANIPVSDIFALRVSGRHLTQDAVIDNVVTDTDVTAPKEAGGKRDEFGLRALGLLQASPNTEVVMTLESADLMAGIYLEAEDFNQDYRVFCGELNLETLVGSCNYIAAARRVGAAPNPVGEAASTLQSLITQERKTAALFSYNTFDIMPNLGLVAGGRLTHELIKGRGRGNHIFTNGQVGINNTLNGGEIVGPAIGSNTIRETNFSGNLGLNYHLNETLLGYVTFSNGFKSGGFNGEVIDNAAHFDDQGLFEPETVNAGEVGVKFNTAALRFNLAGFYNDYNNPQARFFREVTLESGQIIGLNSLSNFDAATSYGVDAEVHYIPVEGLELFVSATFLESEILDDSLPSLDGDALPFASNMSVAGGFDYKRKLSETLGLRLEAQGKYQSEFTTGADTATASAFIQKGYALIDTSATLEFQNNVELGIWARNLTNSDYAVSGYRFFGATTFRGTPRTYGISAKYSY